MTYEIIADSPLNDPNSRYSKVLGNIDFVFTFLFALEAAIKIIALGFFWSSIPAQPYIRNGWNMLDFTVVMASLVDFFFLIQETDKVDTGQLKSLKALRALRALRPLRMISRNEGMRLVVNALFASIPSMTNVLIVCLLFILIFASTGISFFAGKFYYCSDEDTDKFSEGFINLDIVDNKHDCNNVGGQWVNRESNFDNIFSASLTLFEMMTTEGWLRVMYSGIDARGIGLEPKKNNNIVMALFFIAFMVVGSMLIFNLFVGVVIDNFNKIKTNEELGNMFVTESQKKWIEIQRIIMRKKLKLQEQKPTKGIRLKCLNFAKSRGFEWFITICILANTIVMSIKYARMNETYETTLEYFNYVFAAIFNFEAVVKIVGYGKSYFYYSWNKFDLLIVIGTDIGLVMNLVNAGINVSTVATVVRAFRIMRIFRLVKSSQNMRIILDTIAHIMPQVTNIMSLVFLLLFIYAVLGLNLFATVMYQEYYNERANFRSFGDAILLLLR